MKPVLLLAVALSAGACAAPLRFLPRPVVWREPDDAPVAQPAARDPLTNWPSVRDMIVLPLDRMFALEYGVEAEDVNALDEVPQSSWYSDPRRDPELPERRPRALSAEELLWGAARPDDVPVPPLVVTRGKSIGATRGFTFIDARGRRYLAKFDPPGKPGLATSTEVVVSRLAWACGWRVPGEVMFRVRPEQISVAPDARYKDKWGDSHRFVAADLAHVLDHTPRQPDGTILALASAWLPGVNLGPFAWSGTRGDDLNDRIPHQHRRSLRGFGVFASWVNDSDTLENNTLDMYVGPRGRGHVQHFQQDVGGAFGVWASEPAQYWVGHTTYFYAPSVFSSLLTFGLMPRHWEGESFRAAHQARVAAWPELGGFHAERFDPWQWHPTVTNSAFSRLTPRDRYWAAKRLAAFSAEELRSAIAAGQYRPPAAERLFTILWQRRELILRAFLGLSSALDYFTVEGDRLCFDDVWLTAGLGGSARYTARELGRALTVEPGAPQRSCVQIGAREGYRVVVLDVARGERARPAPPVSVHLVERAGVRRIVGVER